MSHGPEHQIEHAEHAVHASHDEFNKRVTMSIAIVAAALACVTMLWHRAHNETLILQGEALRLQGEALQFQTLATRESANAGKQWQYYGTKNLFQLVADNTVDLLEVLAVNEGRPEEVKKVRAKYKAQAEKYKKRLPEEKEKGDKIEEKAAEYIEKSTEKLKEYQETLEKSHLVHEKANRFDYGELGLQFGVVLCSLGILTKGRSFWFAGIAASALGLAVALTGQFGLFMGHH